MEVATDLEELQRQLAQVDMLTTVTRASRNDDLSFLLLKRGNLKFKMYQEPGHNLPHIHIDYGQQNHVATYRIDPTERLAGTLARKYDQTVTEWISSRKEKLLETWALLQAGCDPATLVLELAGDA